MGDDRVKTTVVGHREPHYRGEPRSKREIHRLDERIALSDSARAKRKELNAKFQYD